MTTTTALLDDTLDDIFPGAPLTADERAAGQRLATEACQMKMHKETCRKCGGRGRFIGYTGRDFGPCFKCKGKGYQMFRQSLAEREKKARQAAARKERNAEQAVAAFADAHADAHEWLVSRAPRFGFAAEMLGTLRKFGHLTEKQLAAVERLAAADKARDAERDEQRMSAVLNAKAVDLTGIRRAFDAALASGLKRPVLRLDTFKFSLAPATGRNAGCVYVVDIDSDTYLGKIDAECRLIRSRDCDSETEARIVAACADPAAAATAYGRRTGSCSCCGRELTREESIARAIGPVCASKWGL